MSDNEYTNARNIGDAIDRILAEIPDGHETLVANLTRIKISAGFQGPENQAIFSGREITPA